MDAEEFGSFPCSGPLGHGIRDACVYAGSVGRGNAEVALYKFMQSRFCGWMEE